MSLQQLSGTQVLKKLSQSQLKELISSESRYVIVHRSNYKIKVAHTFYGSPNLSGMEVMTRFFQSEEVVRYYLSRRVPIQHIYRSLQNFNPQEIMYLHYLFGYEDEYIQQLENEIDYSTFIISSDTETTVIKGSEFLKIDPTWVRPPLNSHELSLEISSEQLIKLLKNSNIDWCSGLLKTYESSRNNS